MADDAVSASTESVVAPRPLAPVSVGGRGSLGDSVAMEMVVDENSSPSGASVLRPSLLRRRPVLTGRSNSVGVDRWDIAPAEVSLDVVRRVLATFVNDRRAHGGAFPSAASISGTLPLSDDVVGRVASSFVRGDVALGEALSFALGAVLGGGAEMGALNQVRNGRAFRGMYFQDLGQGSYVLGTQ
jgi:hypothetical protein